MIRLIIIMLLFLLSLLCILKAPTYHLWLAAIVVGEFPWIFIGAEVIVLFWISRAERFQASGYILAAISLILFASPIVRAYGVSYNLSKKLTDSFASATGAGVGEKHQQRRAASTKVVPPAGASAKVVPPAGASAKVVLPAGALAKVGDAPFQFTKMFTGIGATRVPYERQTYAKKNGAELILDFYKGIGAGKRPCVIVVHGGSWESGDSQQLPELNSVLALKGYAVASVNYRLAPKYKSPAPEEDIASAITYLKSKSEALNIDVNRLVLLGRSAGGQIALTAAYRLQAAGIRGVIAFYAPADMAWGYTQPANPMVMDSRKVMEEYLGGTDQTFPEAYYTSTALNYVTSKSVPTLLIHGKNDVLVYYEHSIRLSKKLAENKVPHFLLTWPWGTHGSDYTLNGPAGQLSTYAVLSFLNVVVP